MGGLTQSQRCIAYKWDNRYLAHHRADITDTLASERMKVLTTSSPSFKGSLAALLLLPEFGAPPSDWNPRTPVRSAGSVSQSLEVLAFKYFLWL